MEDSKGTSQEVEGGRNLCVAGNNNIITVSNAAVSERQLLFLERVINMQNEMINNLIARIDVSEPRHNHA